MDTKQNQGQERKSSRPQQRSQQRSGSYNRRRSNYRRRRKVCLFCVDKTKEINWKKVDTLQRFVGISGEITPRRKNGLCAKHQRGVATAIKRARHIALLPFTGEHIRLMHKG